MGLSLTIADLTVHEPGGRDLLRVPALEIAAGALVGVRGPSGAGKSTFLHAIGGLLDTASGTVRWGETELLALNSERRARFRAGHIGMIFQDFLLFEELGAQQNAALTAMFRPAAERATLRARAADLLTGLGLQPTPRPVASFSGGERQRVAVARALANDAAILLADEPTASLDRAAADQLIEDFLRLARDTGKTLIAVSHDTALLARMDRVLSIEDGQLTRAAA